MAVTFSGRVESRVTIPTGGASVSVSNANGESTPQTVTVAAGNYFLTAAGGVSSLVDALETALESNAALHGFPRTAAVMDTVVGGDWTNGVGFLFQDASGNPASTFGSPASLTASGTLTYQNAGIKTGDYAIGFSTNATSLSGGDVFDVTDTQDLILAWVANFTSSAQVNLITKGTAGVGSGKYSVYLDSSDRIRFDAFRASDGTSILDIALSAASLFDDVWHVGIAVIDRSTGKARVGFCPLDGSPTVSAETTIAASSLANANNFTVGVSNIATTPPYKLSALYAVSGSSVATGLSAGLSTALTNFANAVNAAWSVSLSATTGQVTIDWSGYETSTHSLTWTSTTLRDVLGFDANITNATSSTTGADQSPMCWLPDAPFSCDDHPSMTPDETDTRSSESPTGVTLTLSGNTKYAHSNILWQRSPVDRIRESSAALTNASLEVFFRNCIAGQGDISWFSPGGPLQIWWANAGTLELLGSDANSGTGVAGWAPVGVPSFSGLARPSQRGWVGQFDVRIPRLVSSG